MERRRGDLTEETPIDRRIRRLNGGDTFVEKFNRRPDGDHDKTKEKR